MGMDMRAYWLAAFAADYFLSVLLGAAIVLVIALANVDDMKGNKVTTKQPHPTHRTTHFSTRVHMRACIAHRSSSWLK